MTAYRDGSVFNADAPAGRRWCESADHHEWLHMLLDRARLARDAAWMSYAAQVTVPAAPGERPEPRQWRFPLIDPCRGTLPLPVAASSPERWPGDYDGEGWTRLGLLGFEARAWRDGDGIVLQWRPAPGGRPLPGPPFGPILPVPLHDESEVP